MTVWNVRLGRRQTFVKVKKILKKELESMVIVDVRGKQHQLSEVGFFSLEREKIGAGTTIALTVSESVTGWRVQLPEVEKSVKELIVEVQKKIVLGEKS